MGIGPISFAEIQAYAQLTDTELMPWEVQAIRAASSAYCAAARNGDAFEPFGQPVAVSPFKSLAKSINKSSAPLEKPA